MTNPMTHTPQLTSEDIERIERERAKWHERATEYAGELESHTLARFLDEDVTALLALARSGLARQQPVAWRWRTTGNESWLLSIMDPLVAVHPEKRSAFEVQPLYLAAAPASPDTRDTVALGASDRACYEYPGEDQAELRAAFVAGAVSASPDTRVKPLAWEKYWVGSRDEYKGWRATNAIGGHYTIWMDSDSWTEGTCEQGKYANLDEAKAAKQANYNARILSALVASPSPPVSEEMVDIALATLNEHRRGTRGPIPKQAVEKALVAAIAQAEKALKPFAALAEGEPDTVMLRTDHPNVKRAARAVTALQTAAALTHPAPDARREAPTHRHVKRGTEYVLLGIGRMQAERWVIPHELLSEPSHAADMAEVAIYRSVDDGSLWARPREEFEDGRFEPLPAPPSQKADEK